MALLLAYNKPICVCDQQFMHLYACHFVNEMPRFRKTKKAENLLDQIMKDSEVTTWPLIKCKLVPCFLTGKDGTSQKEALSCTTDYHSIYAIFVGLIYLEISILHKKMCSKYLPQLIVLWLFFYQYLYKYCCKRRFNMFHTTEVKSSICYLLHKFI